MSDPRATLAGVPPEIRGRWNLGKAGAGGVRPAPVVFPPEFRPFPGSVSFFRYGNATIAGPGSWVVPATVVERLPQNAVGQVSTITIGVNNIIASSNITFALRVNGIPFQGLDQLQILQQNAVYAAAVFDPIMVPISQGAVIDVMVTVADAANYLVGASYFGWYYTRDAALQYANGSSWNL